MIKTLFLLVGSSLLLFEVVYGGFQLVTVLESGIQLAPQPVNTERQEK